MPRQSIINSLANDLMFNPDISTDYDDINHALMLSLYFKNPPGRIIRKQWTYQADAFPELDAYLQLSSKPSLDKEYFDIDSAKFGEIKHNEKLMLPSDDSVIHTSKI